MHHVKAPLVRILVLLFLVLSFNAYACVLPVVEAAAGPMGQGCATPDEPPVRQLCDAFKTLSVESAIELHPTLDGQIPSVADLDSLSPLVRIASRANGWSAHLPNPPSHDLLLRISVLRI